MLTNSIWSITLLWRSVVPKASLERRLRLTGVSDIMSGTHGGSMLLSDSFCVELKRCSWKAVAPPSNTHLYRHGKRGGAAHAASKNYKCYPKHGATLSMKPPNAHTNILIICVLSLFVAVLASAHTPDLRQQSQHAPCDRRECTWMQINKQ